MQKPRMYLMYSHTVGNVQGLIGVRGTDEVLEGGY